MTIYNSMPNFCRLHANVLFTLNRTTHSSVLLLCVVRFNVNKTLIEKNLNDLHVFSLQIDLEILK